MVDIASLSLEPVRRKRVAVLGYGNQGSVHALNLRDSGVAVVVGARPGKGLDRAVKDGFRPVAPADAVDAADIVMFLFPDQTIPEVYRELAPRLVAGRKIVGFAHGFAVTFSLITQFPECGYLLVGPKGAGALLRENFQRGGGLPGVFAVSDPKLRELATSYAKAIGCASSVLLETTFREETECDLFGEQAVLCGGFLEIMEEAFTVLVENGHTPEMAFFECCYEARMILELWMKFGPSAMAKKISPTACYGGVSRGKRVVTDGTRRELRKIFAEIRSGEFAREWMEEVRRGMPSLAAHHERLAGSGLQRVYDKLKPRLD